MNERDEVLDKAQRADATSGRIEANVKAQQTDLVEWILERMELGADDRVLELCCGTGYQTHAFLERLGPKGRLLGIDISREAIEELRGTAPSDGDAKWDVQPGDIDDLGNILDDAGQAGHAGPFDLVFCAYGLYYSEDPETVLKEAKARLSDRGRIVVVGPFGPNNGPLFDLLRACGVEIDDYVLWTSRDFMPEVVLPWAGVHFERTTVHTLVNPVTWSTPEDVLSYWRDSTFHDPERRGAVEAAVRERFDEEGVFVNEKWVMMAEACHAR